MVKKDRLNHVDKEIDNISTLPPQMQYYAALKKLKSKAKNISWDIQDKDGEILTDKQKILERWAKFYEELYKGDPCNVMIGDSDEDEITSILKSEVENAISELKTGKSPGLDGVYSEYPPSRQ